MEKRIFYQKQANTEKRGRKTPPPESKHSKFCEYKTNTIKSLNEVEHFLNNFKRFGKCMHLYKFFK